MTDNKVSQTCYFKPLSATTKMDMYVPRECIHNKQLHIQVKRSYPVVSATREMH